VERGGEGHEWRGRVGISSSSDTRGNLVQHLAQLDTKDYSFMTASLPASRKDRLKGVAISRWSTALKPPLFLSFYRHLL